MIEQVEAGTVLPEVRVPITRAGVVRYSGASTDFNEIHFSDRHAMAIGLPGVVAHGMWTMGAGLRVVTDWIGDPAKVVEYFVRFTRPVVVPDSDEGVEVVYNAVVKQLGTDKAASSEDAAAEAAERPDTAWGWVKWGFSSLIGVITGSMIPVIGLLAAAGILKGILTLLKYYQLVDAGSTTFTIIDAMGDAVFYFLTIFVGFTAARRLGSDPIIVSIIGGVLAYPSIVEIASGEAERSILGMPLNAEFFGLPFHMASYTYSIFPMIVAAWVGMGAGLLPRRVSGRREIAMLAAYGVVAAYLFGLLMNLSTWPFLLGVQVPGHEGALSFVPGAPLWENLQTFVVYTLITSTGSFDTGRAITTCVAVIVLGPAVLTTLRRAARRATIITTQ